MQIKCPITDEVLATFGKDGFTRRANYREVYLVLSDHSRMKVLISKNAKDNLKENQIEAIFRGIQNKRIINMRGKAFIKSRKDKALESLENIQFISVVDKKDILLKKALAKKL